MNLKVIGTQKGPHLFIQLSANVLGISPSNKKLTSQVQGVWSSEMRQLATLLTQLSVWYTHVLWCSHQLTWCTHHHCGESSWCVQWATAVGPPTRRVPYRGVWEEKSAISIWPAGQTGISCWIWTRIGSWESVNATNICRISDSG